jgi:hypothetical protein
MLHSQRRIFQRLPTGFRAKSTYDRADLMKYLTTPPYTLPNRQKIAAPPMVYISGEEMTRYTMSLM